MWHAKAYLRTKWYDASSH